MLRLQIIFGNINIFEHDIEEAKVLKANVSSSEAALRVKIRLYSSAEV